MLDDLFDMFGGDDDGENRDRRGRGRQQGGIRGFLARLFGGDDDGGDGRDGEVRRRRDTRDWDGDDDDDYEYARGGRRRRDHDDDGGFFGLGDD